MELFFVGALVGVIVSSVWSRFIVPLSRRRPPASPSAEEPPKLPPAAKRRK
jgi:hypothetical protein